MDARRELPLTLHRIQEQGVVDRELVLAARRHVGAAGTQQTAALERIIAVGRSQPSITRALERIAQTLREEGAGTSQTETQALLEATQVQLQFVRHLEEIVTEALNWVTSTPIEHISAAMLNEVDLGAKAQLSALERLVEEVEQRSSSRPQLNVLEQVETDVHQALGAIEAQETRGQVESLSLVGQEAVAQLAALEQAPVGEQIAALEDVAQAAHEQAETLRQQETVQEQE